MNIQRIGFDDEQQPQTITVRMSIAQAAVIAKLTGGLAPSKVTELFGRQVGDMFADSRIWETLVGMVFNRYWEDGVDGFLRGDDE